MQSVFRSLPQVFKDFEDNEAANEAIVFAAWRRISGDSLGSHAVPVSLEKKRLTIAVSSETWKKQVEDLSGHMIFLLNATLGCSLVTFIEFRVDAKAVKKEGRKALANRFSEAEYNEIAMKQITAGIHLAVKAITDKNLRNQFLLAAGSSLARKALSEPPAIADGLTN